jgi:uroporphyrin-III C-methyltransferase/precorrin-2 dehydrogenase/sirohydrochlorin ferrochelatase
VGAGPGDPDLLTVRAIDRLREADLVLYDGLVSRAILDLADGAELVSVARRAGTPHKDLEQALVTDRLIEAARAGLCVVRLKSGDPFVLARGGEEASALAAAGVPVEIVPGISSALAAPALAGIPVTHRGLSSGLLIVSGHAREAYADVVGALPPGGVTLVVLMGVARRGEVADVLLSAGWRPATPAAVVVRASQPDQQVWIGPLDQLAGPLDIARSHDPGVLVIGEVVSCASAGALARSVPIEEISWQPMTTPRR